MKPSELFPGAVVMCDSHICTLLKVSDSYIEISVSSKAKMQHTSTLEPLPMSPPVLRGLGLENRENIFCNNLISVHQYFDGTYSLIGECDVRFTHQLQALCIHLYGVELVWNQSEYKKAMKEETKP